MRTHAPHVVTSLQATPTDLVNFSLAVIRSGKGLSHCVVVAESYLMEGRGGGWGCCGR